MQKTRNLPFKIATSFNSAENTTTVKKPTFFSPQLVKQIKRTDWPTIRNKSTTKEETRPKSSNNSNSGSLNNSPEETLEPQLRRNTSANEEILKQQFKHVHESLKNIDPSEMPNTPRKTDINETEKDDKETESDKSDDANKNFEGKIDEMRKSLSQLDEYEQHSSQQSDLNEDPPALKELIDQVHKVKAAVGYMEQYLDPEQSEMKEILTPFMPSKNMATKVKEYIADISLSSSYLRKIDILRTNEAKELNRLAKLNEKDTQFWLMTGEIKLDTYLAKYYGLALQKDKLSRYQSLDELLKSCATSTGYKTDIYTNPNPSLFRNSKINFQFMRLKGAIIMKAADKLTPEQTKAIMSGNLGEIQAAKIPPIITSISTNALTNFQAFSKLMEAPNIEENFVAITTLTDLNSPSHSINEKIQHDNDESQKMWKLIVFSLYKENTFMQKIFNSAIPELLEIKDLHKINDGNTLQKDLIAIQNAFAQKIPMQLGIVLISKDLFTPLGQNK